MPSLVNLKDKEGYFYIHIFISFTLPSTVPNLRVQVIPLISFLIKSSLDG